MEKRKVFKYSLITAFGFSLFVNVVSANYVIQNFQGDISKVVNIKKLSDTLKQTTQSLNNTATQLISTKNSTVLPTIFGNSFKNVTSVNPNPITTPPYTGIGQIQWSSNLNTLISTDGQNVYVWIGSTWIQIDSNNNVLNTNQNISVFLDQKLGQIPSGNVAKSLNINPSGAITTAVSISNATSKSKIGSHTNTITSIRWDPTKSTLVGTDTYSGKQVAFSISPDSRSSYWSDVSLR